VEIKIWGCRGSLPTPGKATLRFGGNTTCLEINTRSGSPLIVDAGSGIRLLGKELVETDAVHSLCLLLTHSHWDHLIGFPFFTPAYDSRFTINVCGGPAAQSSLRNYLEHQMQAPFFPVEFDVMKAEFRFECPKLGAHCSQADEIAAIPLNHPNGGYGFRLVEDGRSFVFLTDNEISYHHEDGLSRAEYVEVCRGADLLLHDAQYTDEEYRMTRGWGHSTYADAVDLALEAGVKRLGLFHHDPDRTDDDLDVHVEACRARIRDAGGDLECFASAEGMALDV
jgi:phosphoribosyl 1,2-cyclic phosphodiesterase